MSFSSQARHLNSTLLLSAVALAVKASLLYSPMVHAKDQGTSSDSGPEHSQEAVYSFNLPSSSLAEAIHTISRKSSVYVTGQSVLINGVKVNALKGQYTVEGVLKALLKDTDLTVKTLSTGNYQIVKNSTIEKEKIVIKGQGIDDLLTEYLPANTSIGTKDSTPIIEIPQSVSVVTANRLRNIGATRLTEALSYTPGINTAPWGALSQYDWIYIRGFDAYEPGFYMDSMQLRNVGNWGLWITESYGIEQVEVLRGPSSVLYGQNGPGGLVNVVSKQPTDKSLRELQVQVGSNSLTKVSGDFSGTLDEAWSYRLTGSVRDAELAAGDMESDRNFLAPTFTWNPSDGTKLTILSQYVNQQSGADWNSFPVEGTLIDNPNGNIPQSILLGEPDFNRYNQEQWMLGYNFEHRVNDTWEFKQNARYGEFDLDYRVMWGRWAKPNPSDPDAAENFRIYGRVPFRSQEEVSTFTFDNQAVAYLESDTMEHKITLGIDYQDSEIDVTANYGGTVDPLDLFDPRYGASVDLNPAYIDALTKASQTGVYLQNQIKVNDQWVFTIAGRYDDSKVTNTDRLTGTDYTKTDHAFTKKAGLVYLGENRLSPYVSYAESFVPNSEINPATGKPFESETGEQIEVGVRYQSLDNESLYSLAAFDLTRQDYVEWYWGEDAGYRQNGELNVRGLEFEAITKPYANMNLTAAYSWIPKAEIERSANISEVGKQDRAVSEHQLSIWGDYKFSSGLVVGLGARYTGTNMGTQEAAPIKVPHYTLYDMMLGYQTKHWQFSLNARNLTDEKSLSGCGNRNCSYGERRNILATALYRW